MFFFFFKGREEVSIELVEGVPIWSAAEYAHDFEWAYRKLCIVDAVIRLLDSKYSDNNIFISDKSLPRNQYAEIDKGQFSSIISMHSKESSPKNFWDKLSKFRRPAVFFYNGENYLPISTTRESDSLKARISIQSPPILSFEGSGELIYELRFGAEENQRRREKHEMEMRISEENLKQQRERAEFERKINEIELEKMRLNLRSDHILLERINSSSLSDSGKNDAISTLISIHSSFNKSNQKYGAKVIQPGAILDRKI